MVQRKQRRSTREVEAREKVRARRADHWAREQQLEDLATAYEVAAQEIEDVTTTTEDKIAAYAVRLRREAEEAKRGLWGQQAESVSQMLELDGVRSVADRLGEPVEAVRKLAAARPSTTHRPGRPEHGRPGATSTSPETGAGQPVTDPSRPAGVAPTEAGSMPFDGNTAAA
ncbi:hypothetical protein OG478_13650 [Streptomyces phaeochromogenes]|uniref:hypothetical protein n=1 Tax=Streptomyces phaeochromogenes TaxID=1923 RepID=UPI00386517B0|nr:hypothetical protein OG478_13650 [Streptomyces phaeochromogenes]